tara:strand:- start:108 stop:608 length:501 start_codon:yes stop_codon:yes gene_type:complete
MASFSTKTFTKHDDYMTPESAWKAIEQYIPKDKMIWEPFYGDGKSGEHLKKMGLNVHHVPEDFFTAEPSGDIVISNPPYTLKKETLRRLKELEMPFILIMPSSTLVTAYCRELFGTETLQIMIPRKRIQFIKMVDGEYVKDPKNMCNFDCFYFCYKMNLPRDILWL